MTGPAPFSPELLLEHRSFLRALARSLLADEHEADDVVQEAFARALERPPDEVGALRGWLASVVRNASINRLRGVARRNAREGLVARAEAVPSSSEIVERLAVQRRVVEAVAGLREPLRTPVYLRFYEGLPPRAIAQRLDRPVETVRSQIQRGLAQLRAELDGEFGDRRAWGLALLPFAREAALPASPATTAAGASTGVPAWLTTWGGALALLGVAAIVFVSADLFRPPPAAGRDPGAVAASGGVARAPGGVARAPGGVARAPAVGSGTHAAGVREPLDAIATDVAPSPSAVEGRVLRASGPRAGEPVGTLGIALDDGVRAEELVSDAAGWFVSTGTFARGADLRLHDGVERAPVAVARRERLADGSLALFVDIGPTYAFDLTLPPGAPAATAFVARLRDPDAPDDVVEARVRSGALPWVRFAHAPRASLMNAGGRSTWALELASDDGLWGTVARVHAGLELDRPLPLVLDPRARLAGRALDEAGAPVAGVEVIAAVDGAPERRATGDAHGRFELGGLLAGACRVTLRSPRHALERRTASLAAGETSELDVVLLTRATGAVEVTLTSRSGAHEPAGEVTLVAFADRSLRHSASVAVPRSGRSSVTIEDLAPGEWELKPPMRDGFAWDPPSLRVRVEAGGRAAARFTCLDDVASAPVAFRVSDADGRPLERFRAVVLADRYRLGVREAASFEPDLGARDARHGEPCARVPDGVPVAWVVEAEGHRSAQGRRRDLVLEDGVLVADVRLERPWRLHLWVGTRDAGGRERPLSGAVLSTVGGKELGRTLGDGELALELLYDPGRLRLDLDGWRVERWEGFAFGERRSELDRHRVWLVRD